MTAAPDAAIVVPTCNRPALLARGLRALTDQRPLPGNAPLRYEIIVVDDGAGTATREVVDRAAAASAAPLRYLAATGTRGPAAARNLGWRSSTAPLIAFTDDDTIADPHWLAHGLRAMTAGVDAVAGRVAVPIGPAPTDYERQVEGLARAEFITANCLVRRAALQAVGGFDPRYRKAWREDSDLQFALIDGGFVIARAEQALVTHPIRPGRWGASLSSQANVFYDALLYRKFPRLYRSRLRPRPPYHYYAAVASLAAAIGAAAAGQHTAAAIAFGCWAALTLSFALQRLRATSTRGSHVAEMLLTSVLIPPLSVYWRLRGAWHYRVPFW